MICLISEREVIYTTPVLWLLLKSKPSDKDVSVVTRVAAELIPGGFQSDLQLLFVPSRERVTEVGCQTEYCYSKFFVRINATINTPHKPKNSKKLVVVQYKTANKMQTSRRREIPSHKNALFVNAVHRAPDIYHPPTHHTLDS